MSTAVWVRVLLTYEMPLNLKAAAGKPGMLKHSLNQHVPSVA